VPGSLQPRTATLGYQSDSVRQKFTGYERDEETDLDFARARMYGHNHGRFTSPDPFGPWAMTEKEKSEFYGDPQKWNLYVYVTNNPLRYSDPTGLERYDKNTVSQADEDKIKKAFNAILKYGTPLQKRIVRNIQRSDLLITVIANTGASGSSGVTNPAATQQRIDTQRLNVVQALGELTITIDSATLATQKGIEGTLVHETRHAWAQAKAISEFSYGDKIANPFDPDGFAIEYSAHKAYANYVVQANKLNHPDKQAFVNEALGMKVIEKIGNEIRVSERGIRDRLTSSYGGLNDTTNRGKKFSQNWGLTPRNSW